MTAPADAPAPRRDLYAALFALVLPSLITWVYFFQAERLPPALQGLVFGGVKIVQFGFPLAWVLLVERRRVKLAWPGGRGVGLGLAFGAAVAAAMVGLYFAWLRQAPDFAPAADAMREKISGFGLDSAVKFAALGVFYSLCHSLLEEYYWRWFVFGELQRFATFATALVVSSIGFAAHHVLVLGKYFGFASWETWVFAACVGVGGAFWAWLYRRSGSLLGPWGSHLLVDAAIFSLGYEIGRASFAG
ncbi:MAG: hypothetical protein CMJ58_05840 [Planctomycetaceae bacterium]|nr:hypothetical protein [Planctomycetaceae bacterium]